MRHQIWFASAIVAAALGGSVKASIPVIYTNTSNLLPNQANQLLQIYVSGSDVIQGENLNLQINSGASGPIFTGIDILGGTIFNDSNTGQDHPNNDTGFNSQGIYTVGTMSGHIAAVFTTTQDPAVTTDNGLLITLHITTTATTGSVFTLNMINTLNGSSNFVLGDLAGTTVGVSYPHNQFSVGTADRRWKINGGGSWDTDANWTPFAPYARSDIANFLGDLTSGTAAISLDDQRVVGIINFNNTAGSYDIQAGASGSLNLDNGTQSALIACLAGKHSISAPVLFTADTNVSVATGSTLTLSGGVGGLASALALSGSGKLVLCGANSYGATSVASGSNLQVGDGTASGTLGAAMVVNAGFLTLQNVALPISVPMSGSGTVTISGSVVLTSINSSDTTLITSSGALQVGDGGTLGQLSGLSVINNGLLSFNRSDLSTQSALITGLGSVTQSGAGTTTLAGNLVIGGSVSIIAGKLALTADGASHANVGIDVGALLISGSAKLDIKDRDGIVRNVSDVVAFGNLVMSNKITSSTATPGSGGQAIGFGVASKVGGISSSGISSFDGVPVNGGDMVLRYTTPGDVTLDGSSDSFDLLAILNNFGNLYDGPTWWLGDVTGDGSVDSFDLLAVLNDFGNLVGGELIPVESSPLAGVHGVPEPASLAIFGLGMVSLNFWGRSRRQRTRRYV